MISDLFSTFDPQNNIFGVTFSLNWTSSMLGLYFFPMMFWIYSSRTLILLSSTMKFLSNEFKLIIKGQIYGSYFMFISLFIMVLTNNFLGMFPYVFTSSSHLSFTLAFSLTLWISFMLYGWMNFTKFMFAHLVPLGTPGPLMPFMVCIESISNFIRSGTLAVRLTANMISGHLLLTLLGNQGPMMPFWMTCFLLMVQIVLLILEFSVSIIQSYVISILSALYSGESVGH